MIGCKGIITNILDKIDNRITNLTTKTITQHTNQQY